MANTIKKKERDIIEFDEKTIKLIKDTVAKGSSDEELQLFLYHAKKTGLDPLARQIYFMKRNIKIDGKYESRMTIQTSIDGFRLIAQRSGFYAGQGEPIFTLKPDNKTPDSCSITVYQFSKNGERYPAAVGVAYWDEYKPQAGQDFMWNKMPRTMLAKVAEALALRKAFPQDLSGLYADEEMTQAEQNSDTKAVDHKTESDPALDNYRKRIFAMGNDLGLDAEQTKETCKKIFKVESFNDLTEEQLRTIMARLQKRINEHKQAVTAVEEFEEVSE